MHPIRGMNRTIVIQAALALVVAIGSLPASAAEERLRIFTVNYPLQYFAQRIAGEHAEVVFPAPRDVDPAFWIPDVKTLSDYQGADLILLNGANYAKWIDKVSLPRRRLVDTSAAFSDRLIDSDSNVAHSHGPGPAHGHTGTAFTTWLDLQQAILQATAIKQALIKKRPQQKDDFEGNFLALKQDLQHLDTELKNIVGKAGEQALLASHPVYQYLARAYGLRVHSLLWEPNAFPGEPELETLEELARTQDASWMIWEASPVQQSVTRLKHMGIDSIVFDPCANLPERGDFLIVMKINLSELKRALWPDLSSMNYLPVQSTANNEGAGS